MHALLYAPSLAGHPQIYARVIARALVRAGHCVSVAAPAGKDDWRAQWPVLSGLAEEPSVRAVDVRLASGAPHGHLTAEQLIRVQRETNADVTLLMGADKFAPEFRRMAENPGLRLRGRVCAIFARTSEWYPRENFYSGQVEPWIGPTFRRTVGRARRALFNRRATPAHFFERIVLRHRLVDALIVKDERLPPRFGPPVVWMPEIYRVFDVREDERRRGDWERFAEPVRKCVERAGPDQVLLYFGAGAWYKGYDWFLKLALDDPGAMALHAGAPDRGEPAKRYDHDVEAMRRELIRQGRLFETQAFVESEDLIDLVFRSIARFVSTHRLTMSSGTVLQALEADKPVLTASSGLVGWRTREFGLGATYPYRDPRGLLAAWREFRTGRHDPPVERIRSYMQRFSREATEAFFVKILTGEERRELG